MCKRLPKDVLFKQFLSIKRSTEPNMSEASARQKFDEIYEFNRKIGLGIDAVPPRAEMPVKKVKKEANDLPINQITVRKLLKCRKSIVEMQDNGISPEAIMGTLGITKSYYYRSLATGVTKEQRAEEKEIIANRRKEERAAKRIESAEKAKAEKKQLEIEEKKARKIASKARAKAKAKAKRLKKKIEAKE